MLEHRDAFMETLRAGPELRRRVFESLEQRFGQDFGNGRAGKHLYETLHAAVADADVPDALTEFERRFLPLVDGRRSAQQIDLESAETDAGEAVGGGRARGWIIAIAAVAVLVAGLVGGLTVLNTVLAKLPAKSSPPAAEVQIKDQVKEPAPEPQRTRPANPIRTLEDDQASSPQDAPASNKGGPRQ
jgi:hypothetical protein